LREEKPEKRRKRCSEQKPFIPVFCLLSTLTVSLPIQGDRLETHAVIREDSFPRAPQVTMLIRLHARW
jgi:hypothetical protein